jgi:membrane protein
VVGFVKQAGGRMAAALSFYLVVLGGPMLVLTLAVGSALFGEEPTKEAVAQFLQGLLPPSAGGGPELAQDTIRASKPTASLALLVGIAAFFGFTRALTTSLNVTLRAEGTEPATRSFLVGPIFLVAALGLIWVGWAFKLVLQTAQLGAESSSVWALDVLMLALAPFALVALLLMIILAVIPRVRLAASEIILPALLGAALWETARHLFSWLIGGDNLYLQMFGPLGGIMALFGWLYLSAAGLVLTGQFAWAYAMERRGEGHLAQEAPRAEGPDGKVEPFEPEHMVNESTS